MRAICFCHIYIHFWNGNEFEWNARMECVLRGCKRSCLKCEYYMVVRGSLSWLICEWVCAWVPCIEHVCVWVWVGEDSNIRFKYFLLRFPFIFRFMYTLSDNTLICVFNTTLMFFITRWNVSLHTLAPPNASRFSHAFAFSSLISVSIYLYLLLFATQVWRRCRRHTHSV